MVFAAGSRAPLPAPTHELNLGRNLQLFFGSLALPDSIFAISSRSLMRKGDATWLRRTKNQAAHLSFAISPQGTRANAMAEFRSGLLLNVGFETLQ